MAKRNTLMKSSAENKPKAEIKNSPRYTEEEKTYLENLRDRLIYARDQRDTPHEEFDNLDYLNYWSANEKAANTVLKPKKNRGDTIFQSGTLRTKMMAFLSAFQSLNLEQEILAYDDKDLPIQELGQAMETVIAKTEEMETDEEKKILRQYELLKQGTVFVEERWIERWVTKKDVTASFFGNRQTALWTTQVKKEVPRPEREIVSGKGVYLGDIHQYFIHNQPYIFTVKVIPYATAEKLYGKWDMWQYVPKDKEQFQGDITEGGWILSETLKKDHVEVIVYQDKPNNEIQILLNGIPMLPIGYPLSDISADGEYTIVQQNLEPIRHDFAYGKSFIFKNKNIVAVLDRMLELAVLKTHKSFMPPYLNLSDRVISRDVFMPGHVSRGIRQGELQPISEKEAQGVTSSEFSMIETVKRFIDQNTVSPTFVGQREQGGKVTATQIVELQKQARMMMALLLLAASLLEKKLTKRRLVLLLKHWFDPQDQEIDKMRQVLVNKYRSVAKIVDIPGRGRGLRIVRVSDVIPSSGGIKQIEDDYEKIHRQPLQLIYINAEAIKTVDLVWQIMIVPREKQSSEIKKLLFTQLIQTLMSVGLMPDKGWVEKRIAQLWGEDAMKMFPQTPQTNVPQPAIQSAPKPVITARPKLSLSQTNNPQIL